MNALKAIVFDLDDTLYLESDYTLSGFRAVALRVEERLGAPAEQTYIELRRLFEDGARTDTFDRWLAGRHEPALSVADMVRAYRDHRPDIAPLPLTRALLGELRSRYGLGLLTDGHLTVQRRKLAALALEGCFDAVVLSDEHGRAEWKPSPRPFLRALDALGVAGPNAVYVGDNPVKDFLGARRAGIWSIRVRTRGGIYRDLEPESAEHDADVEIERLEDIDEGITAVKDLIEGMHMTRLESHD